MKYLLLAFLIYLAYQVIFRLVVPVYRTTRHIKKGFKEMQQKMQQQEQNFGNQQQQPVTGKSQPAEGDYIDFEEIK